MLHLTTLLARTELKPSTWSWVFGTLFAIWLIVYVPSALTAHFAFGTNAYDLSVFDYAAWSTLNGRPGYVPFIGHSLFAHHFMPTLFVLLPIYSVWPSPATLIVVQLLAFIAAAILLSRLARRDLPDAVAFGLVVAFLFSRRSHSAITSPFYLESLEPVLIFAVVLAAQTRRVPLFVALLLILLGCKEDVGIYTSLFGLVSMKQLLSTKHAVLTALLSAVWVLAALFIAIPFAREAEGLGGATAFLGRYGPESGGVANLLSLSLDRLTTLWSVGRVLTLTASVLFLCWLAPLWLSIALVGIAINLAASHDTLQAKLLGHYLWPIFPWVFIAAIAGAKRLISRWPSMTSVIAGLLVISTAVQSPLWGRLVGTRAVTVPDTERMDVARQLNAIPQEASVLAQPNLIPHVGHRFNIGALGMQGPAPPDPDVVILIDAGDTWPLSSEEINRVRSAYAQNPQYSVRATERFTMALRRPSK